MKAQNIESGTPVVVTTDKDRRGIFFGTLIAFHPAPDGEPEEKSSVELEDVRMAVFYSKATRGVLGLAANGPKEGSRITRCAPRVILDGVTMIAECSQEAVDAWDSEPWSTS